MRKNEQGLTLIELLVVMAIAVILVVAIGMGWQRQENATSSATLTQQALVMMRQARTRALESGGFTQVWIDTNGTTLTLVQASQLGQNPPGSGPDAGVPNLWVTIGQEQASQGAAVAAVYTGVAPVTPVPGTGLPATVTFRPDGSAIVHAGTASPTPDALQASPGTGRIFVNDGSTKNPNRVFVYGLTGYSRSVNGW